MTTSNDIAIPSTRASARFPALQLSRGELFAGLYILGCVNGLLGRIIQTTNFDSIYAAVIGVDLNAIVLFACIAGISAMFDGERDEIRPIDLAVTGIFLALVALPIFPLSWLGVTGLSLYILLFARGGSDRWRGALILLALTVPMLWSRLFFQFFAKPILDVDATLVAWILGTHQMGNMVEFSDHSGYMIVLAPCSSLANMSLAFLCWVSITQWSGHKWSRTDILWSLLVCLSVITVNVTRISLMGFSQAHYHAIHGEWGDFVTNTVMLVLMVGISVIGCRREILARI